MNKSQLINDWNNLSSTERSILGRPNFMCGQISRRLKELGFDCPDKAEDEQALVINLMLSFYKKYKDNWVDKLELFLKDGELEQEKTFRETMNIYTLPGKLVKVYTENGEIMNGWDSDKEKVKKYLSLDKEYAVLRTIVNSSSTDVILADFPKVCFNSVNFENVTEQSEEETKTHEDWENYN